jgi:hypothetical protein
MAKQAEQKKSKYAIKLQYRKKLSGGRTHTTTNHGQPKKYPLPLPLFAD